MFKRAAVSLTALTFLLGATAPATAQVQELTMGGGSSVSATYPYFTAVANSVSREIDTLEVNLLDNSGYARNAQMLVDGELQLGGISPDLAHDFAAQGQDKIRALWYFTSLIQNIMALERSGVTNIAGFDGRCLTPGHSGSSTEKNSIAILELLGIEATLMQGPAADLTAALAAGECEGQVRAVPTPKLDAATADVHLQVPLRPVTFTSEQQQTVKAAMPWINFVDMPADIVPGAEPYTAFATWALIASSTDVEEQVIYDVMRGMAAKYRLQQLAMPALRELSLQDMLQRTLDNASFPLHAGAVRYYQEAGLEVPSRLIPPEMTIN